MVLVSIYDSKAETYTPPHPSQSKASSIREFEVLVNDGGKSMISQHPEDFSLILVGEWLERCPIEGQEGKFTARLLGYSEFECLACGLDLVKRD